ncbi:MAG TPA: hypothetical protein VKP30_20175 [Polyangiaceae bacterium]|nr:hypothetical protein [Polyangiaceae bacterium]
MKPKRPEAELSKEWRILRRATVPSEAGHAPAGAVKAASVLLPTTALALRVLAPPKFVLVAKLLRANGRSGVTRSARFSLTSLSQRGSKRDPE